MDEIAASDPDFKQIYESQQQFRDNYKEWKQKAYLPRDFE